MHNLKSLERTVGSPQLLLVSSFIVNQYWKKCSLIVTIQEYYKYLGGILM